MNKKRMYLFLLLFICSFVFISNVDAGVCNGYDIDGSSGTCKSLTVSVSLPGYLNKKYGSGFLRPGYLATTNTGNAASFCLDPGLPRPTKSLTYIREIDNSNTSGGLGSAGYYDDGIYRMYQLFYNDLIALLNSGGLNDGTVNQQRSYFQNAVRVWTYRNGFDYLAPESAKYQIDAPHFQTCANYIDSNVAKGTSQTVANCFGNSTHRAGVQRYYDAMGKNYIWENPLSITTDSKIVNVDGKKYYRYEFNVKFTNGKYNFFDGTYSKGISYNDIQLGSAEFYLNDLSINGVSCSTGGTCYNYSGGGIVSSGTENQFIVELTEEQYKELAKKSDDGSVNVTMHYGYRHPLNIENLFVARYDLANTFQRMLVIQNFVHYDTVSIGKEPEVTHCSHTASGYTNSGGVKVTTLSQYISSCGCSAVDKTLLTGGDLSYFNKECSNSIIEEKYTGSIGVCTSNGDTTPDNVLDEDDADTNYDDYKLGYEKTTRVNNYCTETCNEDININNLKGRYTTKAGMYFEFKEYPNLTANKKCTIKINYSAWQNDYKTNLEYLVSAYNTWQEAANASYTIGSCCDWDCNDFGCWCVENYYNYKFSYNAARINGYSNLYYQNVPVTKTTCGAYDWQVSTKKKAFQNQASKANAIASLKSDLKVCNNRLFGTTNEKFYDFSQQLNYYYYQTYADGYKVIKNNERASLGGINDSTFKTSQTVSGASNEKKSGSNVIYSTLTESGIQNETIYTYNTDIVRNVLYKVDYERPLVNKYSEIFTGKISATKVSGKSISLGYGYDTDASAIAKSDNNTYYSFTKLGASDKKIFNKFKTGNEIKRYCTYEITNEIIEGCEDGSCDSKLDIVFRIVDPNNLDPNGRLGTTKGFKNWNNIKGQTVLSTIQSEDTFNPDNLEYSFTLDSATIKKIREYDANCDASGECDPIKYSSTDKSYSELLCNEDGNECTSGFITELTKSSGAFGKSVATNTDGRDNWKYLIYDNSTNKWSIEEKKAGKVSFSSLIAQYKSLGVDVTP